MKTFEKYFLAFNRWALIGLLAAMSVIIFTNVVLRYTTSQSIEWAEEVARHMMIWVTFLGAGLVLRFGGHVAIDNFHHVVGEQGARFVRMVVALGLGAFFLVMMYFSILYVWATRFQTTAATDIPIAWIYAAMPVGFLLLFVHLLFVVRAYVGEGKYITSDEMDAESAASL